MGLRSGAPLLRAIDAVSEAAGRLAALAALALVLLVFALVLARYGFGLGSVAAQEAVLWLHAAIFLLGLGLCFRHDRHVRVDVFSARWQPRTRARVELAGIVLLLLPLCLFAVWISLDYVAASWSVREGSRDPGGLPGWYLLKALIPLSAALLALQGLAQAARAAQRAVGSNDSGA
ncbi:MAG TPA: TRAP transporter small permease subunit [Arenimonas sp.]|nr:TRAP transporter small permease subunit [Arenimonas sp.]